MKGKRVMPGANGRAQVTLSNETVHNPDEPRHFMRLRPVKGTVRILFDGRVLAESNRALRLLEAGHDIYDPVLYIPPSDIRAELSSVEKKTFCPLKGHASYFDLVSEGGAVKVPDIAWSYQDTLECAAALKDLIAFDASRVVIEEHPVRGQA